MCKYLSSDLVCWGDSQAAVASGAVLRHRAALRTLEALLSRVGAGLTVGVRLRP